ncbi:8749_t:CDS:2 [Ambispora gerdemannii]|uniref:8749_t:CDS:1 n=1 Tax=Ambispora gerdemannii TaxID=144530 RepID=A0A9N9BAB5_9GLOM|nr:8749_t:CDS:2 [Ambispora gerdemannii]
MNDKRQSGNSTNSNTFGGTNDPETRSQQAQEISISNSNVINVWEKQPRAESSMSSSSIVVNVNAIEFDPNSNTNALLMQRPIVPSQAEHNNSSSSLLPCSLTNVPARTRPLYAGGSNNLSNSLPPSSSIASSSSQRRMNQLSTYSRNIGGSHNQRTRYSVSGHQQMTPTLPSPILPGLGIVYSASGFDVIGLLARVATRPNPQINLGPVDLECSLIIVDARIYDYPVIYANNQFERLTGYPISEIIGRNCRFLQAPDGRVTHGSKREFTDPNAVHHMRNQINSGRECQTKFINYRKGGEPFLNCVTVIPITWDSEEIAYYVGFARGFEVKNP